MVYFTFYILHFTFGVYIVILIWIVDGVSELGRCRGQVDQKTKERDIAILERDEEKKSNNEAIVERMIPGVNVMLRGDAMNMEVQKLKDDLEEQKDMFDEYRGPKLKDDLKEQKIGVSGRETDCLVSGGG